LTLIGKTGGDFEQDEILVGPVSGATGRVVSFANTNATGTTGILKVVDINGVFVNERITGNTSAVTANVTSTKPESFRHTKAIFFIRRKQSGSYKIS
jgi:hypothetical protein